MVEPTNTSIRLADITYQVKQLKTLNKYKENTIGAISRYDVEYMRYYTGLDAKLVPSYGGFYMEGTYKPTLSKYLIFTVYHGVRPFIDSVKKALQSVDIESDFIYDVYKFYKTSDLISHPAVISLPYSVMSFRLVELYALGIPLFIPSLKFFKNNGGLGHDRTSTSEPYCDKKKSSPDLEAKMRPGFDLSTHLYSPNVDFAQGFYNTGWFKKQFLPCWLEPRQSVYLILSRDTVELAISLSTF